MIGSIFDILIGCSHRRLTRPLTPVSKPGLPSGETYVVCLDCGKQFSYDWDHMRVGKAIARSRDSGVLHPEMPGPGKTKLKYALLGSAIPVAVVLGSALFTQRRKRAERPALADNATLEQYITLPHGGFRLRQLVERIEESDRDYIVVGSVDCAFADHPRPHSLDYWLREHCATNKDMRQATEAVLRPLLASGLFVRVPDLRCPDTGEKSEALRLQTTTAQALG